jgi:DNA (cytosine-5)-methyltransferase 1
VASVTEATVSTSDAQERYPAMYPARPRLLDLFCGAGGAAAGYARAGFEIVGVDIKPQPHYPFDFIQMDALEYLDSRGWRVAAAFEAIHASPPCQFGTAYRRRPDHVRPSPNLVHPVRQRLEATGLPHVIEQPWVNRRELWSPVRMCGSSFRLDVQRHRAFETNFGILPPPCDHSWQTPRFPHATNRTNLRRTVEVGVWRIPLDVQQRAMGIDWMTREELSEAIPPAYTEHIGRMLLMHLRDRVAA